MLPGGGGAALRFHGEAGGVYDIERSGDLTVWTRLHTLTASEGGLLEWTDSEAEAQAPKAFYRARRSSAP